MAQSAEVVEYTDCIFGEGWDFSDECPEIWHETIGLRGYSNAGALRNEEYLFIAISLRCIVALRGSTW